jgi:hypothetical protein
MNVLFIRVVGLFALIHVLVLDTYSQVEPVELNQPYSAEFGDFRIGLAPVLLGNTPNGMQFGGSIYLRVYLNKYVSFDTDLCLSRDYLHLGPGIFGIPIAMLFLSSSSDPDSDDEGTELSGDGIVSFLIRVTLVLLSVEHMSAHIPVYQDLEISPYVSFLRYRSQNVYSGEMPVNRIPEQFCFAAGLSIEKGFGRFVLSPFIEYNIGYKDKVSGYIAGLECSMRFSLTRKLSFR